MEITGEKVLPIKGDLFSRQPVYVMKQYSVCLGRNNLYVIDQNKQGKDEIRTFSDLGEVSAENSGRKKYWSED